MGRWEFGEPPLPETERFAAVVREASSLVLAMEGPSPVVAELTGAIERATAALRALAPPDPAPRVGAALERDGRVYLDHARHVGAFNPAFPVYELQVDGDHASGTVTFPALYEGPPGIVHGGFVALLFDLVIQHHNCDVGTAGKTAQLDVRYAAPSPLLTELRVEVDRTVEGRWIHSTARLLHGEVVTSSATMRAVAGDRAALPPVSPRRPT